MLVLHGDPDPVAPFDQLAAFREEMRLAQANWEININGGAGTASQAREFQTRAVLKQDFTLSPSRGFGEQLLNSSTRSLNSAFDD